MKDFIDFFDLLLSPFNLLKKLNINYQRENARIVSRSLKFLFILPLFLSSLLTIQAMADLDSQNDTCPPGEVLTIGNGSNTFFGTIERNGFDYYQITVPADGNITITWQNTDNADKVAAFLVGVACNSASYYNGTETSTYHEMNTTTFSEDDIIFIKIYDGEGNDYDLTIDYQVDTTSIDDYDTPTFCYDYYYQQNTVPLNETEPLPYIDDNVTVGIKVDINLYIKNLGSFSDDNITYSYLDAENMIVDIIDINSTDEAIYSRGTTYLREPGAFYRDYIPDTELTVSDASIKGIEVGDVGTQEFFSIDFSIIPEQPELHFPLNAKIKYDVSVPIGNTNVLIPQVIYLQDGTIPKCVSNASGYSPAYSIFNVEHNALTSEENPIYNLPTQTAMRVDDLKIISYDADQIHERNPVRTIVSIELIDANKYGDISNSCGEYDSAITPRITEFFIGENDINVTEVPFNKTSIQEAISDGRISDQILNPGGSHISSASEFYSVARENVAFRLSYNTLNDGSLIQIEEGQNGGYRITNFPTLVQEYPYCKQPVKNPNNQTETDLTPVACSDAGQSSTLEDLAICMECIYGYTTRYLCSRDNFAIRPESFRVSLSDQDQESPTTQNHIKTNLDDAQINIVAGYQYALEVNATNYLNDNNTLGYDSQFVELNATNDKYFSFVWQNSIKDPFCNDINDHNKTMVFNNGLLDSNISNAQIGYYELEIFDKHWTRYDHDSELLEHHSNHPVHGNVDIYFNDGLDCVANVTTVPEENFDPNTYIISGCDIKSEHTRYADYTGPAEPIYTSIDTMIYPYEFSTGGLTVGARPTNDESNNTFVYINTPDLNVYPDGIDENMSYNVQGTFAAVGKDGGRLSNFVDNCYAENIDMSLYQNYNHILPTQEEYLSYDLIDHNTTDSSVIIRTRENGIFSDYNLQTADPIIPLVIPQGQEYFEKDMEGSITMDLGYNFVRAMNVPLNPRDVNMRDFNLTYTTPPTGIYANLTNDHEIFGNINMDQNVTFLYGRAKPAQTYYETINNNIDTPVSVVVYCDLGYTVCQDRNILALVAQTSEATWWKSWDHNNNPTIGGMDGTIELVSVPASALNATSVTITSEGEDPTVNVNNGGVAPLLVPVNLVVDDPTTAAPTDYTDRWLIYNEYSATAPPIPFYRVKFLGASGWVGKGETGHVVGAVVDGVVRDDVNTKNNKRLEW